MLKNFRYIVGLVVACFALWLPSGNMNASELTAEPGMVADGTVDFVFFGTPLHAPILQPVKVKSASEHDVFRAWSDYQRLDMSEALSSLRAISDDMGLNDWLVLALVRSYVDALLSSGTPVERVLLEQCLLVNMGYDVRLARTNKQLLLLVPFEQEVYERCFVKTGGKDYYLMFDDLESDPGEKSVFYPCEPSKKGTAGGKTLSLLFNEESALNIPTDDEYDCDFDDGMIHVACKVNPRVMQMLRDYPLMDLECYAASVVLPQFRDAIEGQLMPQLEGMSQCDAADALLHFVQFVFGYEDDMKQYGREKVNFVEENFYYDKNDCEDRSVLYAYLVHALLGLDVQFIQFPGHDCTAVRFTDCLTRGNGYYYGKDYYLICDPSYIGAPIGQCMPEFRSVLPVVKTLVPVLASETEESPLVPRLDKRFNLYSLSIDHAQQGNNTEDN